LDYFPIFRIFATERDISIKDALDIITAKARF
jgi:hypothetical protein